MREFKYRRIIPGAREPRDDDHLEAKVRELFGRQDTLFERLPSEPKIKKLAVSAQKIGRHTKGFVARQNKKTKISAIAAVLTAAIGLAALLPTMQENAINQVAGDSDNSAETTEETTQLEKITDTEFPLLYSSSVGAYDIVRISPNDAEPAYTYLESVGNTEVRVTQQKIPSKFTDDRAGSLSELARSYQTNAKIEVDGEAIYHGFNSKSSTQTVIFFKEDNLVFVVSPRQLEETEWVNYYLSLKY